MDYRFRSAAFRRGWPWAMGVTIGADEWLQIARGSRDLRHRSVNALKLREPVKIMSSHEMEGSDRALAQAAGGGAGSHPPQPDPDERGREHGLRGGTGGTGGAASGIRVPRHTPRYVETRLGILSYAEFAPHLARNVLGESRAADFLNSYSTMHFSYSSSVCSAALFRGLPAGGGPTSPSARMRHPNSFACQPWSGITDSIEPAQGQRRVLVGNAGFRRGTPPFHSSVRRFQRARDPSLATRGPPAT